MVVLRCGSALILLETKDSVTASVFMFWQRYVCRTGWTHGWFATSEAFLLPPREESRRPHTGIYVRCSKNSFHLLSRTLGVTSLPPREESCRPHTDIYVRCSKNSFHLLSRTLCVTSLSWACVEKVYNGVSIAPYIAHARCYMGRISCESFWSAFWWLWHRMRSLQTVCGCDFGCCF